MTTAMVLSGPERRRRWTEAEKVRIVEESLAGEVSVAEVARRHDVHPNLLHRWRQRARAGAGVGAPGTTMVADGGGFSRVVVASDGGQPGTPRSHAGAVRQIRRSTQVFQLLKIEMRFFRRLAWTLKSISSTPRPDRHLLDLFYTLLQMLRSVYGSCGCRCDRPPIGHSMVVGASGFERVVASRAVPAG